MKLTIHEDIKKIPYYPKAMMYGYDEGWVRLSSNENPFPPSPKVFSSILDALFFTNRYPGGELELKSAIAKKLGTRTEEVLIGNGSNELIEMTLKAMKHEKKNKVIISDPSFAFYAIAAQVYGYEVCKVPLVDMHVDLSLISKQIDKATRVIFLNNPLNPTGTIFWQEHFEDFLKTVPPEVLIVADEAYAEFVESAKFPHTIKNIAERPVLVLRTFSKAYGLAGLRIGYGIGEGSLVSFLERTKQPFSVNMMALIAAQAALSDGVYLKKVLRNNKNGKLYFNKALKGLSVEFIPSEANFILVKLGKDAEAITKRLFEEKVLVRWMGAYGLPDFIRVSVGRMDENKRFIEALRRVI
jgi:histidinol-phosphate aminotransferase